MNRAEFAQSPACLIQPEKFRLNLLKIWSEFLLGPSIT